MKTTSKIRFFVILAALGVLFALNAGGFASAIGNLPLQAEDKIEPGLRDQILADGQGTYILQMAVQADLGLGYRIKDRAERGQFVYDTLRKTAASSQANIKIYLNRQLSEARVSHYQSFFIANAILVTSDLATLDTIAARGDVAYIYAQKFIPVPEPDVVKSPEVLEWGVEMIRADEVWSAYGVTGQGIVVANIDTGVRLTHEALVAQYRGTTTGSDDYNFYDPANICGGAVCDNHGHGTHTMGTMVGDDGGANQIGVAPGAQWIAAKGCEGSTCSESSLLSSAEWMLAPCPFGVAPGDPSCDPNMRPDVINNSWGGGGGDPWYQASVNAWDAAGILHVFSAGNSGPGSNTIGSPSDYCNTLSIGATDFSDVIGSFSSRGPGAFANCTDKPDMSAPGVNVRSSVNSSDTAYANYNGTSMAAPHVTGCIALLLSLDYGLIETDVFNLLTSTAVDLGTPGFDYDYGWGRIDCFAAASQLTPDFRLTANPNQQAVCFPDNVIYDMGVSSIAGYSDQVTLSTVGVPTGYTSGFSDNPVEPPGSSTMTLTSSGTALAGSYSIDVVGVAATSTHTATVTLDVYITVPGTPVLASPVNGATEVGLQPTFTWSGDAPSYFIEIATDPDFTNIVASATVNDPTYVPGIELAPSTFYFWRVTGSNSCGDGAISSTFYFVTQAAPGACSIGQTPNVLLEEGFESGATPPGWSHSGNGDTWTASTARNHTGSYSFHADDPAAVSEQYLYTPPIILPNDEFPVSLQFWNHQTIEDRTGGCFDGALLDISTDGGSNWTQITSGLLTDPYDGPISSNYNNPRAGDDAWCGDPQDWLNSAVDLNPYAGQTIQLRFGMTSDNTLGREGWYIDEVVVQSCLPGVTQSTLDGTVTGTDTSDPLEGALISVTGPLTDTITDDNGYYTLNLPVGVYTVTASATGYFSETVSLILVTSGMTTTQDFALEPILEADLSLSKTAPVSVTVSSTLTYVLSVNNVGSYTAFTTTLTDTLPTGVTFVSASAGCSEAAGVVTCALGDLASGAGVTLTIVVTAEQAGTLINTAEVSSTVADPDLANNTASVETEASEERFEADLSLMKTAPADVTVGSPFTYTLEVTNLGPDTAHTTILTDTLPTGVTFVSATSGCNEISGTVTCDLGDLGSGSSATITIVVTADVTGTQTNSAEVSSSITDPVPENNTAFTNTDVVAIPPPPEDEFWLYLPIVIRD